MDATTEGNLQEKARKAILKEIAEAAPRAGMSTLKDLAEAYAWVVSPGQPHGGSGSS